MTITARALRQAQGGPSTFGARANHFTYRLAWIERGVRPGSGRGRTTARLIQAEPGRGLLGRRYGGNGRLGGRCSVRGDLKLLADANLVVFQIVGGAELFH